MSSRGSQLLALVGLLPSTACLSEAKVDPRPLMTVQVSKSEPGPWCRSLGAVEGASDFTLGSGYSAAYQSLRANAAARGGNYVVIDHVNSPGYSPESWRETMIGGRLFMCPSGGSYAVVRVPVTDPPEQISDGATTVVRPAAPTAQEIGQ